MDQFKWLFQITLVSVYLILTVVNDYLYVAIAAQLVDADNISNVTFPDPNSNFSMNSSIFIPASYIEERSMTTGKLFILT